MAGQPGQPYDGSGWPDPCYVVLLYNRSGYKSISVTVLPLFGALHTAPFSRVSIVSFRCVAESMPTVPLTILYTMVDKTTMVLIKPFFAVGWPFQLVQYCHTFSLAVLVLM